MKQKSFPKYKNQNPKTFFLYKLFLFIKKTQEDDEIFLNNFFRTLKYF